ncbi:MULTISPECIES: arylesterase [unclassified Sphingomonas]|uniref:arylesterase n=1 Tax=unclassified Sphingomonas TaxID=196159 RepID=UPI0006F9862F|nr:MULTISPECIES: arylesterase [unclassified Sphingomonas]KQX17704.1 acyl-CoA thioesterase [Sphingomonas sp. Root1294]KQY70630.1 acyl-CoA thioesterase [Sphingomonas sp. Root50]KRB91878.1 acyl-CoA thioesterase [Sphingomonas sp. Root720]
MTIFRALLTFLALVTLPVAAQAADKLVLAFGDSLTAGYRLPPGKGFVPQLEAALRKSGLPARVHNAGVSGDTTAQGKARLNWVLASLKAKPDLVIVELGANDMLRGLDPGRAEANLDAILAELSKRRIKILLAGMVAAPNLGADYARRFDPIYRRLADKYHAGLYPFFLQGIVGDRSLHIGDAIHPNEQGVSVIVRGILPQVKRQLAAR